jgi:hypothetical protein
MTIDVFLHLFGEKELKIIASLEWRGIIMKRAECPESIDPFDCLMKGPILA